MENYIVPDFIVIDDDFINNVVCQIIIQNELHATSVQIFTIPKKGLEHINTTYSDSGSNNAVLFLDINMPALNGWEVLDQLANSTECVKQRIKIFIFSSSLTPLDKQKATENSLVSGYIEKPLKSSDLQNIIKEHKGVFIHC